MKTEIAECCRQLRLSRNIAEISDQIYARARTEPQHRQVCRKLKEG